MPQIFHRSFNTISRVTIFGAVFIIAFLGWCMTVVVRSSYATNSGIVRAQPIPFSHQHHVRDLGIDCRYCHATADKLAYAGMPTTKICMNCHQQIWTGSEMLEPVRESYRSGKPIQWNRIHRLADFVYFDHSVHVNKGVGCVSCHGQIDDMPLTWQHGSLLMEWCLNCHRAPENFIRPRDQVFSMTWKPSNLGKSQEELGASLMHEYHVEKLIHCSACHR